MTPNEEQCLKEYVSVMKSLAEALDVPQAKKNVGMGFLLPTISFLKNNLKLLKDDASIIYCQPLATYHQSVGCHPISVFFFIVFY